MIQVWKFLGVGRSLLSGVGAGVVGASIQVRPFSVLTTRILQDSPSMSSMLLQSSPSLSASPLQPPALNGASGTIGIMVPVRGMKVKAKVYHRCRDCYFQYSMGILYNLCRKHGRHKQMLKPKYWVNQRIITAVCQTPKKPW